jgi:hypothetical protein
LLGYLRVRNDDVLEDLEAPAQIIANALARPKAHAPPALHVPSRVSK